MEIARMGSQASWLPLSIFLHHHIEFQRSLDSSKEFRFEDSNSSLRMAGLVAFIESMLRACYPAALLCGHKLPEKWFFGFYKGCILLWATHTMWVLSQSLTEFVRWHGSNDLWSSVFSNLQNIRLFIPAIIFNIIFSLAMFSFKFISFIAFFQLGTSDHLS